MARGPGGPVSLLACMDVFHRRVLRQLCSRRRQAQRYSTDGRGCVVCPWRPVRHQTEPDAWGGLLVCVGGRHACQPGTWAPGRQGGGQFQELKLQLLSAQPEMDILREPGCPEAPLRIYEASERGHLPDGSFGWACGCVGIKPVA